MNTLDRAVRPRPALRGSSTAIPMILMGVAAIFAYALFAMADSDAAKAQARIDDDRVVVAETRDVIDGVTASGRVEPLARVAIMSRAGGILEELHVDEGDVVEAGQVIAELDREQLQAERDQDQADLLAAEARVQAAEARLVEARTRALDPEPEFLRREVERLQGLLEGGTASTRDRDEAARALANAEFRVQLVTASLPVLEAAQKEAEAQLAASRAAASRSETALREATIRSPIDGVVLVRHREVGDGVSSILTAGGNATEIFTLGDLSSMHIEARVDEVDLGRIHTGMSALVTVDAHRGRVLQGAVEKIAPAGSVDDNGIVTFQVDVSVRDDEGLLRPDMTADAKLVVSRRDGVVSLPQVAVRSNGDGGWFVERIAGEGDAAVAERVQVSLGLSDGLMTEIESGLAAGDRVLMPISRRGR